MRSPEEAFAPAGNAGCWDIVIAGGGLTGIVAAGELALNECRVLFLESRHVLAAECTQAKCPSGSLRGAPGRFMAEVRRQADGISHGGAGVGQSFLLELALERSFLAAGGTLLYGAVPAAVRGEGDSCIVEAAVKNALPPLRAAQGVLWPAPPAPGPREILHSVLLVGARNSAVLTGECETEGARLAYRVSAGVAESWTTAWISHRAESEDAWAAERHLAGVAMPFVEHLRARHAELSAVEVVYLGDEPLVFAEGDCRPDFQWITGNRRRTLERKSRAACRAPLDQLEELAGSLAADGVALAESLGTEIAAPVPPPL